MIVNDVLRRLWKRVVMACFLCMGGLRKSMKNIRIPGFGAESQTQNLLNTKTHTQRDEILHRCLNSDD
jgi:hypothetical protein